MYMEQHKMIVVSAQCTIDGGTVWKVEGQTRNVKYFAQVPLTQILTVVVLLQKFFHVI